MTGKHPIKEIVASLDKTVQKYIELPEGEEYTEQGLNIAEELYALTDNLLSTYDLKGDNAIKNLLGEYISSGRNECFDILNNTLIEIISSAETNDEVPYTLMWVGINSFGDSGNSIDLDGYDTVIQNALFQAGITSAIDDSIVMKEALPIDMIEKISLSEVYTYTGNCLGNMEIIQGFEIGVSLDKTKMFSETIKNFYIPVFIKGIFDDVLERLAESLDVDQIFEEVSSTYFKEKTVIFIPPVLWDEATEKNATDILNQSKLVQMLAHIRSEDKKDTELSLLKIEDKSDTFVFMFLGKNEGELLGFLILENQTNYLEILQEIIDFCTESNYGFLCTDTAISNKAVENLLSHSNQTDKVTQETQNELLEIFSNAENIDTTEWYKLLNSGATKSIH